MSKDTNRRSLVRSDYFQDDPLSFDYNEEGEGEEVDNSGGASNFEVDIDSSGNLLPNKASIGSCVINLLNTVAGAGMLGLPGAYAGAGYVVGTLLLIIAAFFSALGLRLLSVSAATVRSREQDKNAPFTASFYTIARAALPESTIFIDGAVALKCFGVATGYFVTVGDCMVDSFHYILRKIPGQDETTFQEIEDALLTNRDFWVLCAFVFVIPISFFKTLDSLKFTSTMSLMLIYGLAIGIIAYAQGMFDPCEVSNANNAQYYLEDANRELDATIDSCKGETEAFTDSDSTLKNISIFVFSFTCHQNVFTIVNELKNPTQRRVDTVFIFSIGCALLLYLVVAIEGYATYGNDVKGNILLNYPQTGLVTVMRIGITVMVVLSYPLQLDPSRRCLTSLIYAIYDRREKERISIERQTGSGEQAESGHDQRDEMLDNLADALDGSSHDTNIDENEDEMKDLIENFLFYGITCGFLVLSFMIAMTVTDLGTVLGVVGATGSTMVSYVLPGAIYIKLHPSGTGSNSLYFLARLQLTLGMIIIPVALYFVLFKGGAG